MNMNIQGAAEAASFAFVSIGTPDGDLLVCKNCAKAYRTERGLNVHHMHMHEEEYRVENIPFTCVKAHWDGEELVLLAMEELWLTRLGEKNINHKLADKFPHRSLEHERRAV